MIKEALTRIRDGILDFEDALGGRVNALLITGQMRLSSLVSLAFNEARDIATGAVYSSFGISRAVVSGAFALLTAATVVVIGDRPDPLAGLLVDGPAYGDFDEPKPKAKTGKKGR